MKSLLALTAAVMLTACATASAPYPAAGLRTAPDEPGGDLAFWRACSSLGLSVNSGQCGRWVGYDFIVHEVPAELYARFRGQ
jgi:hypothetical protein